MKPLIDELWDRDDYNEYGVVMNFERVASKKQTQVFVFSPEVALAAEKLIRSNSFSFPKSQDMHMPYEHTAIEYELTPDIRVLRDTGIQGSEPITRVGAHIREIHKTQSFLITPYWQFATGLAQSSFVSFIYGLDYYPGPKISLSPRRSGEGAVDIAVMPNLAAVQGMVKAGVPPEKLGEMFRNELVHTHIRESGVELPLLLFASSMLLTCKSGIAKARVDARTPNISGLGAKKRKQLSSSAYTLIHLSALEKVSATGEITSHVGTAAHYVRGHFKQRKSGVYWWNPFVRGTGEPRKRTAYNVTE